MFLSGIIDENLDFLIGYQIKDNKIYIKNFREKSKLSPLIVDTGYQGSLILTKSDFQKLDLRSKGIKDKLVDANQNEVFYTFYKVKVVILGKKEVTVNVAFAHEALVGNDFLMSNFDNMHADFKTAEIDFEY